MLEKRVKDKAAVSENVNELPIPIQEEQRRIYINPKCRLVFELNIEE